MRAEVGDGHREVGRGGYERECECECGWEYEDGYGTGYGEEQNAIPRSVHVPVLVLVPALIRLVLVPPLPRSVHSVASASAFRAVRVTTAVTAMVATRPRARTA